MKKPPVPRSGPSPYPGRHQPNTETVRSQFDPILDALAEKLPRTAEHLEAAREDILTFTEGDRFCRLAQLADPGHPNLGHLPAPARRSADK